MCDADTSFEQRSSILFQSGFIRQILTPFLPNPPEKPYVFIVGCYSSGTTLLNHLLGLHEEISGLDIEGVSLTSVLNAPEKIGWARMMHRCLPELRVNLQAGNVKRLKKQWGFIHDSSKPFFLEKSVSNWARIEWLERHFQKCWFIWITRNGYAVSEGLRRRSMQSLRYTAHAYPVGFPIRLCAQEWVESNRSIEEQLGGVNHSIKISYENLTENTEQTMQQILDFLPIKKKSLLMPEKFTFHERSEKIRNMNFESIRRLADEEITSITSVARDMLLHHGYEILDSKR